ncbi:MAG: hypothetical protein ACE14M_00225 [Terriglobales bacterium]
MKSATHTEPRKVVHLPHFIYLAAGTAGVFYGSFKRITSPAAPAKVTVPSKPVASEVSPPKTRAAMA